MSRCDIESKLYREQKKKEEIKAKVKKSLGGRRRGYRDSRRLQS